MATAELMEQHAPGAITEAMALDAAGADPEVLRDHFGDLDHLVRRAQVLRFARYVDESIATITMVLHESKSRDELRQWLHRISASTQDAARANRRMERAAIFGAVAHDPELRELLAAEQRRLTDSLVDLAAGGQGRGWVSRDVDPYAIAVMVQAYTLGRVVDDVTGQQMDPAAWTTLVGQIVDRIIIASD